MKSCEIKAAKKRWYFFIRPLVCSSNVAALPVLLIFFKRLLAKLEKVQSRAVKMNEGVGCLLCDCVH